jgi:hypothetical protein
VPYQLFEIVFYITKMEQKKSEKFKNLLFRRARIISLFWNSYHIDRRLGNPVMVIALKYIKAYSGGEFDSIGNDLKLFEKYKLIKMRKSYHNTTEYF